MLQRLEQIIFFLILLFLPTQFGRHFWPHSSYVLGARVDYLSPTLYLTDVLVFILFLIVIPNLIRDLGSTKTLKRVQHNKKKIGVWVAFVVFLVVNILFSKSPMNGWYSLLKLAEMIFFGFYVAANFSKKFLLPFILGVLFESGLAIVQFINQSSIGGLFYFLGERTFNGSTPGIANVSLNGQLMLRPYATFSHPNVLAGYLTIVMTIIIFNLKSQISLRPELRARANLRRAVSVCSLILGTIALLLTMSRVAILLWFLVLALSLLRHKMLLISFLLSLIALVGVFSPLSYRFTSIMSADQESVILREQLNTAAVAMIKQSPIFGVGLGNFLLKLPQVAKEIKIQPAHNIYLLIVAEGGIVGLLFFLWFIGKTIERIRNHASPRDSARGELGIKGKSIIHNTKFIILAIVLFLGLFDHYFLTLQQGQLLLAFVMGLCWFKRNEL